MPIKNLHKLLITGSTGLVGSKFVQIFKHTFSITTIGRENVDIKLDLTSKDAVIKFINSSDADVLINFAAYTNVDQAEKEKGNTSGEVYTLNTLLPLWMAESCQTSGKKLYHISTDYVFNGKQEDRPYTEADSPSPVDSWYAITKLRGELSVKAVFNNEKNMAIIRISFPYSGTYTRKLNFARVVIEKLKRGETYFGVTDQKIKPVSVDDIAQALSILIKEQAYGIYHVAGKYEKGYITPYEFAIKAADIMNFDKSLIKPVSFLELSKQRSAPRPQHTWLDTKKVELIGMKFSNFDQSLNRFKKDLSG